MAIAKATGGTITYDGNYVIHTFLSSGTFSTTSAFNVETIVVAGGGGGGYAGSRGAGGGGGGGLIYDSSHAVTAQAYPITVGDGGAGGISDIPTDGRRGADGANSVFDDKTADGGGGGGEFTTDGRDGGSGGGGAGGENGGTGTGGTATATQGYDGGDGYATSSVAAAGGGGGGAGAVGTNGVSTQGGNGGVGLDYSTEFGTSVGVSGWFAGGGAGDSGAGNSGTGGTGGGAADGAAGTANTGGGGGGNGTSIAPGAGGSGIVIIKYLTAVTNMTLVSESTEAEANPDNIRMFIVEKDTDAITLGTDYKGYCSRDAGANWVEATLTDEGDIEDSGRIFTGVADVSGQASDKTIKWKIETLNNKDCDTRAVGLLWD